MSESFPRHHSAQWVGVWHLITGEYPPDIGGVSDYTATVARALAEAGAEVHVWSIGAVKMARNSAAPGEVVVHRLASGFGPLGLSRLNRAFEAFPGPRTIVIQYLPHAYGWKAMNVAFVAWAEWRAIRGDDVRVMFHEVAFPWVSRPLRHNVLAAVNRGMAAIMLRACSRGYVTIPGWLPLLRRLGAGRVPIALTPVPSNVPDGAPPEAVAARRSELSGGDPTARVACHFGTYSPLVTRDLGPVVRALLDGLPDVRVLLLGAGGDQWRTEVAGGWSDWRARVVAPGPLPAPAIAEYLRACDLAIQPYPDGASGRRTTLMAALANGVPVVTTIGHLSEPIWSEGPVATVPAGDPVRLAGLALELLDRPEQLGELGRAGRQLYEDRFAIRHTVAALLDPL